MNEVDALVVPPDLVAALAAQPPASQEFAAFPASVRRNTLRWIAAARTSATRSRRIDEAVASARDGRHARSHG